MQEVDRRRLERQEEERRLPEKLKSVEQIVIHAKEEWNSLKTRKADLEKKKKEKDLELKVQEENIIKLRDKLAKLKTNEEYKAHLKEIESAKTHKREQEDAILGFMEEEENIKKEVVLKETAVSEAEHKFAVERQEVETALAALSDSTRAMDAEAVALSVRVDKDLLDQYQKLLSLCKGLAVVPLQKHTCTGCHFNLPPQRVTEVRIGEKILTCSYCHRILYWVPPPG